MALLPVFILLAIFLFWTGMLARVHRELKSTGREALPMTFTFYSFGVAGVLILLGRRGKSAALAAWVNELMSRSPEWKGPRVSAAEGAGQRPAIHLVGTDGKALHSNVLETPSDGALGTAKAILQQAIAEQATDIHLEPEPDRLRVRYRIDGMLQSPATYPAEMSTAVVSALKVMAGMDVAERRRAQDGSFSATFEDRTVDFRVSTLGASHGEKMAIRILDRAMGLRRLQQLGLSVPAYRKLHSIVRSAHGMLVVCGPTGSGKTTTLYATLQEVDRSSLNVLTIEDPIEYQLENVTQYGVNEKAGITFASLLRPALRQDPDILMVGEIRDEETAEIAMQAAMTGHFVYTTLHSNDTISAILRLVNVGVQPYLITSSLTCVLAQRLVRRICKACRRARTPTPEELEEFRAAGFKPENIKAAYEGKGCQKCRGTGYRGRIGVFELLSVNEEIQSLIQHSPSLTDLKKAAAKAGLVRLRQDALSKAAQGFTTMQEALRVT